MTTLEDSNQKKKKSFRFGFLIHLDTPDIQGVLAAELEKIACNYHDPVEPLIVQFELLERFQIRNSFDQPIFEVKGDPAAEATDPALRRVFDLNNTESFEARLLYAVEHWNTATYYIGPKECEIALDPDRHLNASSQSISETLLIQDISHYRIQLTQTALKAYPGKIGFAPVAFQVTYASIAEENAARAKWKAQMDLQLEKALLEIRKAHPAGWCFTLSSGYRGLLLPDPDRLSFVGTKEQAEQAAIEYQGLCSLVEIETGKSESRWAAR